MSESPDEFGVRDIMTRRFDSPDQEAEAIKDWASGIITPEAIQRRIEYVQNAPKKDCCGGLADGTHICACYINV